MKKNDLAKTRKAASGERRQRRSPAEIRDRLLAAARAEFKRRGYGGTTTAAIASTADVTEAQLFRYYDSKSDLFKDAVFEPLNRHFSDFNARHLVAVTGAPDHRDVEREYIGEFQQFLAEHAKLLLSLLVAETYSGDDTGAVAEIDSLHSYFERGAAMMAARLGENAAVDPALMVRVSFAAVLGSVLFKDWLFSGLPADEDEINTAIQSFVLDGISANSTPKATPAVKSGRRTKQ